MQWPFRKRERGGGGAPVKTEDRNYTDGIIKAILDAAGKSQQSSTTTGGLNAAASILANALSTAVISGPPGFTPPGAKIMRQVGRDMIMNGEAVIVRENAAWVRASSWEIAGPQADEATWHYRLELTSPTTSYTIQRPSRQVAHFRDTMDAVQSWTGIAVHDQAKSAGDLAGRIEQSAAQEASSPVGNLIPVPVDGADDVISGLKQDFEKLDGGAAFVESLSGWDSDQAKHIGDWKILRIGPQFSSQTEPILRYAQQSIFAALGLPVQLLESTDGAGQRESWRRTLHGFIQAYGAVIGEELATVAGKPVTVSFDNLFASDIASKARAAGVLVKTVGLSKDEALRKVGLD